MKIFTKKTQKKTHKISGVSIASTHCGLKKNNKDDLVLIKFEEPQLAITPGQSVVFYDNDILIGGLGNDFLTGGSGNDIFEIVTGSGSDLILDYSSGEDSLRISGSYNQNDFTFLLEFWLKTSSAVVTAFSTPKQTPALSEIINFLGIIYYHFNF